MAKGKSEQQNVKAFNAAFAVGTLVKWWPGERPGPSHVGTTQREAVVSTRDGRAITWVAGNIVPLDNVEVVR